MKFTIQNDDFIHAGEASSGAKKALTRLGIDPKVIKRAAIAMYEAEINTLIHADGGEAEVEIFPDHIMIRVIDHGPGIEDVDLAMQAGWSTASDFARQMGFGAGMGLPNIKRNADRLDIETVPGQGTALGIRINF